MEPSSEVRSYSGCIANEVRFHMAEGDSQRITQNSGVMVLGENSGYESVDKFLWCFR